MADLDIKVIKPSKDKRRKPDPIIEPRELVPQTPFRIYVTSGSGSGKTNLIMHLLFYVYNCHFHKIYLIAGNYFDDDIYRVLDDIIPEEQVIIDPDEITPVLEEIFDAQSEAVNKNRRVLIIIDDHMLNIRNNKALQTILTRGRAKNISSIIINQKFKSADPTLRNNLTHVIFFKVNDKEIKHIHEEFGTELQEDEFYKIYKMATLPLEDEQKPFLLIDNTAKDQAHKYRRNLKLCLL